MSAVPMQISFVPSALKPVQYGGAHRGGVDPARIPRFDQQITPSIFQPPYEATRAQRQILPRAIHALVNQTDPSSLGSIAVNQATGRALGRASASLAGLGDAGTALCTSKPAQVLGVVFGVVDDALSIASQATANSNPTASQRLSVAGQGLNIGSTVYGGVCDATGHSNTGLTVGNAIGQIGTQISTTIQNARNARTGVTQPALPAAGTTAAQLQAAGASGGTARMTPDQMAANAQTLATQAANVAATNPNAAAAAQQALQPTNPPPATTSPDNTKLYVIGAVAAAVLLGVVVLR